MNCSMPGLSVHHQLPEFTQTHVHWVGDAIQPFHPLSFPSPPALDKNRQKTWQWKLHLCRWEGVQYITGEEWKTSTNNSRKNEVAGLKWKWHRVVDMAGGERKVRCCKEQYCIGTWNVRSMNQSKLDMVKQEIARANINILGISELKWTGMGEFNSDNRYIYYCGRESIRINAAAT